MSTTVCRSVENSPAFAKANQQFFLLAFVERKLFTQLVHNYFPDEKGPASRGTGVAFASTIAFGCGRVTQDGSLVLALPLRTCFLVRRSAGSAGGRVYRSETMTLKEAMIRRANGRGRRSGAVEAVVA